MAPLTTESRQLRNGACGVGGKGWCPWYEGGVRWPCTAAAAESSGKFILPGGLMFGHHSMWARTPPNPPAMASSKTRARSIRWRPASPCTPRHLRCILGPGQTHAGDGTHGGPQTTPATNTFRHCLHAYLLFLLLWHFISSHLTCDAPTPPQQCRMPTSTVTRRFIHENWPPTHAAAR